MNSTYEFINTTIHGLVLPGGNLTGALWDLQNDKADMTVQDFTPVPSRLKYFDFVNVPIYFPSFEIIFHNRTFDLEATKVHAIDRRDVEQLGFLIILSVIFCLLAPVIRTSRPIMATVILSMVLAAIPLRIWIRCTLVRERVEKEKPPFSTLQEASDAIESGVFTLIKTGISSDDTVRDNSMMPVYVRLREVLKSNPIILQPSQDRLTRTVARNPHMFSYGQDLFGYCKRLKICTYLKIVELPDWFYNLILLSRSVPKKCRIDLDRALLQLHRMGLFALWSGRKEMHRQSSATRRPLNGRKEMIVERFIPSIALLAAGATMAAAIEWMVRNADLADRRRKTCAPHRKASAPQRRPTRLKSLLHPQSLPVQKEHVAPMQNTGRTRSNSMWI